MSRTSRQTSILALSGALACSVQGQTRQDFPIEEARRQCVTTDTYYAPIEDDECAVAAFDLLAEIDGYAFYYALYRITAEVAAWPSLRDVVPEANALVLFVGAAGGNSVRIRQAYHEDFDEFVRYSFSAPEVTETSRGKVLHVLKRGLGGGTQQWFNDEYWLWQWNDWQLLDFASWYEGIDSYVPSGYAVDGVSHFDLGELQAVSAVRRFDDAQCCPSGGIIRVSFDWFDRSLSIRNVEYDPDGDISK